jgi:hypothetical protein
MWKKLIRNVLMVVAALSISCAPSVAGKGTKSTEGLIGRHFIVANRSFAEVRVAIGILNQHFLWAGNIKPGEEFHLYYKFPYGRYIVVFQKVKGYDHLYSRQFTVDDSTINFLYDDKPDLIIIDKKRGEC